MSGRGVRVSGWVLAVDFGTTATAAAVREPDGRVAGLVLSDGTVTMPSSVFADPTGVLVGTKADSAAGYGLDRYQPTPKRDIGRPTVLLGESEFRPCTLIAAVYAAVIGEAVRQHNHRPPAQLVLTHPVDWSDRRLDVLREAVSLAADQLGIALPNPTFMPEPVAAATHYARLEPSDDVHTAGSATFTVSAAAASGDQAGDQFFAVYDLGGGTFDATVLCLASDGFEVLATGGIDPLGGFEFDNRLFNYFGRTHYRKTDPKLWQALAHPDADDPDSGMRRRFLDATVRQVKEELSEYTQRTVRLPGLSEPVLVTRTEFENLIRSDLDATIAELEATLARAGLTAEQLAGIYRIGGSSRIPLVGRLLDQFQRPVHVVDHPKTVVALGAAVDSGVADEPHIPTELLTTAPVPVGGTASVSPRQLLVDEVTALHRSEKWQEVVAKADELARLDPGDPDPGGMVADARARLRQADLADRYARGVELLQKAQWRDAIRAFAAIEQEEPGYRDTSALISAAQKLDETTGSDRVPTAELAVETSPPRPIGSPLLPAGSRRRRRPSVAVVVGAAGVVAFGAAIAIFVGMQDSKSSKTSAPISSVTSSPASPSLGASAEAPRPITTIDDYIKANNIQATTVTPSTPGAPKIDLPVPTGWTRMPEGAGGNYFGVVFDAPTKPDDAPRFIVTVEKLLGDVDTEKLLDLAAGAAEQLPGYAGDPPVRAPLSGFPGARLAGTYTRDGAPRMVMQYVVVIPAVDGTYLMRISADGADADADAVRAAAKVLAQETAITA
jgi:molecular chaperone DnaK (HSP70)